MNANRPSFLTGLGLMLLGILFLLNQFIPGTWPVFLVGLGFFFLVFSFAMRSSGLAISGPINLALGAILLYQTMTNDWASWYYLWPLIFASVGAGMLLMPLTDRRRPWPSSRYLRVSWAWLVLGLVAAGALWFWRGQLAWPSIPVGMGALFMLVALASGVGPFAIPGSILGGIGLLLAWQFATGSWESWAYTWALIPGFVGLGLFLAFLRSRTMRIIGLSMLGWSLVVFTIFGVIFAGEGQFARFWPIALILAGLVVLVQTTLNRRPARL
jgi:hypothetical protein